MSIPTLAEIKAKHSESDYVTALAKVSQLSINNEGLGNLSRGQLQLLTPIAQEILAAVLVYGVPSQKEESESK